MYVLNETDGPTIIQIGIYVNSFYSFSEQTMVRVVMHPAIELGMH